jgi:TIR domain
MPQQYEQTQHLKPIKIQRKVSWLYIALVAAISLAIVAIIWKFIGPIIWILRSSGIIYLAGFLYEHWLLIGNLVLFAVLVFILILDKLDAVQGHWASALRKRSTYFVFAFITLLIFGIEWFLSAENKFDFFYALFTVSLGILGIIIAYKQLHPSNAKLSDGTEGQAGIESQQETNPSQSIPKDILISYSKQDQVWAEWIAHELNAAEFSTVFRTLESVQPGNNLKLEMDDASKEARLTMLVLSPDYLNELKAQPHWVAVFKQTPQELFLVVVHDCEHPLPGALQLITSIYLVALDEATARQRLLSEARRLMNKQGVKHHFPVT